ncbi:MAG TPA: DUF3105 domain-containing protein [Actinomycetota bacterium]
MATKSGTRGQGPSDRRPTKAERREQARLEREQIQRKVARRRRNRTMGLALVAIAAVAAIVGVVVLQPGDDAAAAEAPEALLRDAASAAEAASCTDVQTIDPYDGVSDPNSPDYVDQSHIGSGDFLTGPALSTYPSIPPTSGPHAAIPPGPIAAGIYDSPPDLYRAIHSLEHGATIVWYRPGTSQAALDRLTAFFGQSLDDASVGQDRVIVAPYDYPDQGAAGQLPSGVNMALVAWHRLQSCGAVSLPVAFDLSSRLSAPSWGDRTYEGEAPEAGATL